MLAKTKKHFDKALDKKFGPLTVVGFAGYYKERARVFCKCDCGSTVSKVLSSLINAKTTPKGCTPKCPLVIGVVVSTHTKHGRRHHPLYVVWNLMKNRCHNPNNTNWGRYGGRGISVCDEWRNSFEAFWDDMSQTYSPGLQIDRVNNDLGYCKSNCRWVTPKQNNRNRCNTFPPWVFAEADKIGIKSSTLHNRVRSGMDLRTACTKPVRTPKK